MKKQLHQPLVSLILPVSDGGEFLRDAIGSILNQTYPHWELLLVDDHATKEIKHILSRYVKRFSCIKKVTLRQHRGLSAAINLGYTHAKGNYIARMDAATISHPQRLAKQVAYLLSHPQTIVVGSAAVHIDTANRILRNSTLKTTQPVIFESSMINRTLLPSSNHLYMDRFGVNDEYLSFFQLLSYGKFATLKDTLIACHIPSSTHEQTLKSLFFTQVSACALSVVSFVSSLRKTFATLPSISLTFAQEG